MERLYLETPLSQAILGLFTQINDLIEERTGQEGAVKAYLFGGCALHILTNARGSNDVDAEFEAAKRLNINEIIFDVDEYIFVDSDGEESVLQLDDQFNVGLPPLSPDYKSRAIPLRRSGPLHVFLVSGLDIAVSKLGRLEAADLDDIIALYSRGLFSFEEFERESEEALAYSATPQSLKSNIDYAKMRLREVSVD